MIEEVKSKYNHRGHHRCCTPSSGTRYGHSRGHFRGSTVSLPSEKILRMALNNSPFEEKCAHLLRMCSFSATNKKKSPTEYGYAPLEGSRVSSHRGGWPALLLYDAAARVSLLLLLYSVCLCSVLYSIHIPYSTRLTSALPSSPSPRMPCRDSWNIPNIDDQDDQPVPTLPECDHRSNSSNDKHGESTRADDPPPSCRQPMASPACPFSLPYPSEKGQDTDLLPILPILSIFRCLELSGQWPVTVSCAETGVHTVRGMASASSIARLEVLTVVSELTPCRCHALGPREELPRRSLRRGHIKTCSVHTLLSPTLL